MAVEGAWRAVDDHGVVVTMKTSRVDVIALVSNAGTVEFPVCLVVLREDGSVESELVVPTPADPGRDPVPSR